MSLPARLYPGYISIYGAGSVNGITRTTDAYQFGVIEQMWPDSEGTLSIGQSVLYKVADTIQVIYDSTTYYLTKETNIILIESPAP